jgi:hypothetical protein
VTILRDFDCMPVPCLFIYRDSVCHNRRMSDVFWAAFGGGAAAGILVLIAECFRWYLDRPLVNVKISTGFIISQANVGNPPKQIFLEAINPHSKPVTLTSFGLAYRNPKLGTLNISPQFRICVSSCIKLQPRLENTLFFNHLLHINNYYT